ncbi:MAG: hypothetical protein U0441_19665 [Polyangiaceae bacterium]
MSRPSLFVAAADPVIYAAWTGTTPRLEDASLALATAVAHARAQRQCGLFVVLHPDMPLPDAAIRDVIQLEMRKMDPYVLAGATVLTRDGFRGTAMRAIVSTAQLLSRPTHPEKIVSTPKEAAAFLQKTMSQKLDRSSPSLEEILAGYEETIKRAWNKGV